jgi:adenosine deaminase
MPAYPVSTSPTNTCARRAILVLEYRALKAIARNALIYSFLDEAQKRDELARFDRASAEFERSVASRQSPLQNAVALIKAAVTLPL